MALMGLPDLHYSGTAWAKKGRGHYVELRDRMEGEGCRRGRMSTSEAISVTAFHDAERGMIWGNIMLRPATSWKAQRRIRRSFICERFEDQAEGRQRRPSVGVAWRDVVVWCVQRFRKVKLPERET